MNRFVKLAAAVAVVVSLIGGVLVGCARMDAGKQPGLQPSAAPSAQAATPQSSATEAMASSSPTSTPAPDLPKAIDFTLETLDGRTVSLSDYFGEKAVVLNFWATWCPPCRAEMPEFDAQAKAQGEEDIVFLMVNLTDGTRDTPEKVKAFLSENSFSFQNVLLDTAYVASDAYGVASIPTTYFIDKNGYIVAAYSGMIDANALKSGIDLAVGK